MPGMPQAKPLPPPPKIATGSFSPPPKMQGMSAPPVKPAPRFAAPAKSILRFLPLIIGAVLLFFVGKWLMGVLSAKNNTSVGISPNNSSAQSSAKPASNSTQQAVTLTYWGLWEQEKTMRDVLTQFEKENPGITVNYQLQKPTDYRERLQAAVAGGRGPDIFRFHASWTPMLIRELQPLDSVITAAQLQELYYPVATSQLVSNKKVLGVPLMYDGLALFYNEDVLRTANATTPATWAQLKKLASELRLPKDTSQPIQRAGVAIGNASNVDNFSDIIGLLMLQNGAELSDPSSQAGQDAMLFYVSFVKNDKVWNSTLPSSTVAFARGDVAMIIAPSWRVHDIKALNPNLKFGIAPVPQLGSNKVTWSSYWAEGLNAHGKYQKESALLLKYLSSSEVMKKLYSLESQQRAFGEIYPRKDMAGDLSTDVTVAPFLLDAQIAKSGYLNSYTHDSGLNDKTIKYYEDAVNALLSGKELKATMETVKKGTNQVLKTYNLPTSQ